VSSNAVVRIAQLRMAFSANLGANGQLSSETRGTKIAQENSEGSFIQNALQKKTSKPVLDATEKSRLIKAAVDQLKSAHQIDERDSLTVENAVKWYEDTMPGVTDAKTVAGAMEIELRTRHGLAIIAEGERRGGSRKVSEGQTLRVLSGAEKIQRHEDRVLAQNQETVGQYVQDSIQRGAVPSVTAALRLVTNNTAKAEPPTCLMSFKASTALADKIERAAKERNMSAADLLLDIVERALQ
jgi:hypothetical protein